MNSAQDILAECSICGLQGDYSVVQQHFDQDHVVQDDCNGEENYIGENMPEEINTNEETGGKWTNANIKLMLELYRENVHLFKSAKKSNKSIWLSIAKKINEKPNTGFTSDQCDLKFRNLKKTYKRIIDSNGKTGRGAINWPYFDIFHNIFGTDADVNPTCLASNTSGLTYSTQSDDAGPSSEESSCSSSRAEDVTTPTRDPPVTPRSCRKKNASNEEPEWIKQLRADAAARHQDKMNMLKELINVLKK